MSLARALGADPDADDVSALLADPLPDQLAPPCGFSIPPPTIQDVLRQCNPSRELIGLLSNEATRLAKEGNLGDAAALVALALCVREVVPR